MAFAKGKETVEIEARERKFYTGIGIFNVLAVNPSKQELEKIYGFTIEKEPEYLTVKDNIKNFRIDFIIKHVKTAFNPIEFTSKISFFLRNEPRYTNDKSKIQVVNDYGEFSWVTIDHFKNKTIPENMSWFEGPYYACYSGEENLTAFMKAFLNVPNKSFKKPDGTIRYIENKDDARARLEKVKDYFNGNISELKNLFIARKDNKIKLACGVKITDDNKMYQTFYDRSFVKFNQMMYTRLYENIRNDQRNGAFQNVDFGKNDLFTEYKIEPSNTQIFASEPAQTEGINWLNQSASNEPQIEDTSNDLQLPNDLPF